ncbi:MAG: hypothetical protein WAV95_09610 [Azonexus sp.]
MSPARPFPADQLAALADTDTQRTAARMAQDIFAGIFRLAVEADPEQLGKALADVESRCANWCQAGGDENGRALRTALLISGLDQWGLAYTQAFKLTAMPALSSLIGALRSRLNAKSDALFQQHFQQIEAVESDAVDFKIELRRNIHLALWHAMAACETGEAAQNILRPLGGMLVALNQNLPELGWRLVADTLANIQIALLNATQASPLAHASTQQLFEALRQAMPAERYQAIMAHSGQVILAWQQARRNGAAN